MRNLHPDQLKLFMGGEEWKSSIDNSFDKKSMPRPIRKQGAITHMEAYRESMPQMWERKEAEARAPETIKTHDVQWRGGRGHRVTIAEEPNRLHGSGVYDSMKEKGYDHDEASSVNKPTIYLRGSEKIQGQGHHRVAAAAALEQETPGRNVWIPTNYQEIYPERT